MDLSLLAAETTQGATMQIYHPKTGKPVEGMTVTVLSLQHETVQAVFRKHRAAAAMRVDRQGKPLELTEEQTEKNAIETYQALIESWEGFVLDGKPLKCDKQSIAMIVSDTNKRWDWLLGDVLSFASNLSNYFRPDESGEAVVEDARLAAHKAGKGDADAV